jgi:hypothetical protein
MRKTRCKNCKKEVDEATRQNSIQEFDMVFCSTECMIDYGYKNELWGAIRPIGVK